MDRRSFLKLAAAFAATAACDTSRPTPTASGSAAPSATGGATRKLSLYAALDEATATEIVNAFGKARADVIVTLLPVASGSELATRIRVERAAPKADAFTGGPSAFHALLGSEGLLEPYVSPSASAIDARYKDPAGLWTGCYTTLFGFAANTGRLRAELGGRMPATWDDLLDPSWKGKLVIPDPKRSDEGYLFVATQFFRLGRDDTATLDYLRKLHANAPQYPSLTADALALVARAGAAGGPSWSHDAIAAKRKGSPIDVAIPSGATAEVGAVSILRSAKDLAAARAFVDWMLSREAEELVVRASARGPTRGDVAPADTPSYAQAQLVDYDWRFAADGRTRIIGLWERAIGERT
ncbi:MAG TPA: extracellular solute-binding protein [Candidatus Limnocylindria bacterium]